LNALMTKAERLTQTGVFHEVL